MRSFWKGDAGVLADFAKRITGSGDLFNKRGRKPWSTVNFVTAHDGFNLNDLVSHNDKHNEANGEDNRDGHSNNYSWNHGVEGPTNDSEILRAAAFPITRICLLVNAARGARIPTKWLGLQ